MLPYLNLDRPPPTQEMLPEHWEQPNPRWTPLLFWYLWLVLSTMIYVLSSYYPPQKQHETFSLFGCSFLANTSLLVAWAALAIHPVWTHFVPLVAYYSLLFILVPETALETKTFLYFLAAGSGLWLLLRCGGLVALDIVRPKNRLGPRTPRLAERFQLSIRSLIILCSILAVGLYLSLRFTEPFKLVSLKHIMLIDVPCTLLLMWAILSEVRWFVRIPLLLLGIHHWTLGSPLLNGSIAAEYYNWSQFVRWLGIPGCQMVSLCLLRLAGYRLGLPKLLATSQDLALAGQAESPWNEPLD